MMKSSLKYSVYSSVLLITYVLLFSFSSNQQLNNDFSSFYAASLAYLHHENPYQQLAPFFLTNPKQLAINLNPPFFLFLMSPLTHLSYPVASLIWQITSLILGITSCLLCFFLAVPRVFFIKNFFSFILIYLAAYATLMNTSFNQVAGLLFFLIITGYTFYVHKKDYTAGLFWGMAVAIKLFPALLFIFALVEKRYKTACTIIIVFIVAWLLPLLHQHQSSYSLFFTTINTLLWYGNSWNASVYGMVFRLFRVEDTATAGLIGHYYQILFSLLLACTIHTLKKLKLNRLPHHGFCFTLIMMLLLSPFGWMYYFSLLLMPLIMIYQQLTACGDNKKSTLWCLCLFFLNAPIANINAHSQGAFFSTLTIYSVYFYGLVLTLYLFLATAKPKTEKKPPSNINPYRLSIEFNLSFGVCIVLAIILQHIGTGR